MKFLSKDKDSSILVEGMQYKENAQAGNKTLLNRLMSEQNQFCAYTEKFISKIDTAEVEHFDPQKKYNDDYFNYYAVIRYANLAKRSKENKYKDALFLQTLFFHNKVTFNSRVIYLNGYYQAVDSTDQEAVDLIDYLSLNDERLVSERFNHVELLKETFDDAEYDKAQQVAYLTKYKKMLDFATAIEYEFEIDLKDVINS